MGWYSCKDFVGVVLLIAVSFTVTNGGFAITTSDNDESMMCFKPPLPATNGSIGHHGLFQHVLKINTPTSPRTGITLHAVILSNTLALSEEQCSVSSHVVALISIPSVKLDLDCKINKSIRTTVQTSPLTTIVNKENGTTTVDGIVYFKDIVSDVALNVTCLVNLGKNTGILVGLPNITLNFYLKLLGCQHGMYGIDCLEQCSCSRGVECHPFTGACVCPKGLQGESCHLPNPMVLTGPTTVFVSFGEALVLNCVAYGMYKPLLMQWEKDGSPLPSAIIHENVPYSPSPIRVTMKVKASTAAVDGVYTCKVKNAATEFVYRNNVNVIVTDIPQPFLEAPVNQTVVLGQRAQFRCRTKPEAGNLTWMVGNHTELSNITSTGPRVVKRDPSHVLLVFDEVRFEDAGMYRCIVGHTGANDSAISDAWLTVQSQGEKPFVTDSLQKGIPEGILRLTEDEEVVLVCEVDKVYPEPIISWLVGNESRTTNAKVTSTYSDDGVSLSVRSRLTLQPTWEDNGKTLVCHSKVPDFNEDQSRVIDLEISYAPKVTISPKGDTFQPGSSPVFKCSALANPSTNMTYKWLLNEQNGTIVKNFNGSSVQIHDLKPSHNKASLTCFVENDVGMSTDTAVIRVFDTTPTAVKLHYAVMISALTLVVILIAVIPVMIFKHRTKIHELFFNRQKLAGNKLHDVFIAHKGGGEEEDFIRLSLVPKLEEWGCDVCVHFKNFRPGAEITENIQTAVSTSRKTILVLSPDFMASEWCYYEFLCAMDEMLRDQTDIIPLMYQDIQHLELCDSMRHLLQTVSYVPWVGGGGEQGQGQAERFWKPLKRAVETHLNVYRLAGAEDGEDSNDSDVSNDDSVNNNCNIPLIP